VTSSIQRHKRCQTVASKEEIRRRTWSQLAHRCEHDTIKPITIILIAKGYRTPKEVRQ